MRGGKWPLVGYMSVLCRNLDLSFYSVIGGWTLAYIVGSVDRSLMDTGTDLAQIFNSFVGDAFRPLLYHALFMVMTAWVVLKGVNDGIERWNKDPDAGPVFDPRFPSLTLSPWKGPVPVWNFI